MRKSKLKLNLDEMTVDSFLVDSIPSGTGTVKGHSIDEYEREAQVMESYVQKTVLQYTQWYSCGGTCGTCPCQA
jgi:hypothetical protein